MRLGFAVLITCLFAACTTDPPPPDLWITGIEITNESDPFSLLDVELHLYDADTDEFIGCAGQNEGMEPVDASDREYVLEAQFYDLADNRVTPRDLLDRNVIVEVWEDDNRPCPVPASEADGDDPVGFSKPLPGSAIGDLGPLSFGNVRLLTLDVY